MPRRSSLYTPELAATICERLAAGESLRAICRDEGMPVASTVLDWERTLPEFGERYAAARALGYRLLADEILDIADGTDRDRLIYDAQEARLRVDTRKWLLSKMLPKTFGDKVGVEHSGGVALQVVTGVPGETFNDLV